MLSWPEIALAMMVRRRTWNCVSGLRRACHDLTIGCPAVVITADGGARRHIALSHDDGGAQRKELLWCCSCAGKMRNSALTAGDGGIVAQVRVDGAGAVFQLRMGSHHQRNRFLRHRRCGSHIPRYHSPVRSLRRSAISFFIAVDVRFFSLAPLKYASEPTSTSLMILQFLITVRSPI